MNRDALGLNLQAHMPSSGDTEIRLPVVAGNLQLDADSFHSPIADIKSCIEKTLYSRDSRLQPQAEYVINPVNPRTSVQTSTPEIGHGSGNFNV